MSRLNIIKILSHRSWKLSKNTLVNIYRSLIGSLFDYIHFAHCCIATTNINHLQIIQNKVIRTIFRLPRDTSSDALRQTSQLVYVVDRLKSLQLRYLRVATVLNGLVSQLHQEYSSSINSIIRNEHCITPLCIIN
jgi:hypothetical protein